MWQRSTVASPKFASFTIALVVGLVANTVSAASGNDSPVYASATNLQAHINSFGTHTRDNMIYLVREGYDGRLTVADLYEERLSNSEAQARCQTLLRDLQGAPASDRVANVWVLSGLEGTEEQHSVCKGRRE